MAIFVSAGKPNNRFTDSPAADLGTMVRRASLAQAKATRQLMEPWPYMWCVSSPDSSEEDHEEEVSSPTTIVEVAAGTSTIKKCSNHTTLRNYTSVNTWTVKGLDTLHDGTTSIESVPFIHLNGSKWCMVVTNNSQGLHLHIMLKNSASKTPLRAKLSANKIISPGMKRELISTEWDKFDEGECSEMAVIRKANTVEGNSNLDAITLQCEVTMQGIVHAKLPVVETTEPKVDIVKAVHEIFHKEVLTDFEFHAGGSVLKAHRALLSVRSPYLAAMLQPHTKEAQDGFVEVSEVKPEALKQLLLYMYTGEAPALKDIPWDLLIAADKFQVHKLKRKCEVHIASCLAVDNAAETAAKASVFSCDMLFDYAVCFVKRNLNQVMPSSGWVKTIAAHPETIQRISELME